MSCVNTESEKSALLQLKMKELSIVGFSYMGSYTMDQKLSHLCEVERILDARRATADAVEADSLAGAA